MGLPHSSEGCQLKSINSCTGLIKNLVSTMQTNYELVVYCRQLHSQSEKNQSISKLVPSVFQAKLSPALKGNLPAPDLPSNHVLFT